MNDRKLTVIFYVSTLIAVVFGLFYRNNFLIYSGHILPSLTIAFWYYLNVKENLNDFNYQMIFGISFSAVSDVILIILPNQLGLNLNIITGTLFNVFLIYAIRKEGVRLYKSDEKNKFKILIPFLIVFLFFGKLVLPVAPESTLFFTTIYSLILILLLAHCLVRKPDLVSFRLSAVGSFLLLFKDLIYAFHYIVFNSFFEYLYLIMFPLSSISYFLIIAGLVQDNVGYLNRKR